jgi:hypothetical protein
MPSVSDLYIASCRTRPLKVTALRGNFASCAKPDDVVAFFLDTFALTVQKSASETYSCDARIWEFSCEESQYHSRVAANREHTHYQLGHTTVSFYLETEDFPQGSVEVLVVVPTAASGPVVTQTDILKTFSKDSSDSFKICRMQSSDSLSCWTASAKVSKDSFEGRLVLQVSGRKIIVTEHVLLALRNVSTGEFLTAEAISANGLEQTVISVLQRDKGATVVRVEGKNQFECRSVQDLGTLRLGDSQHNTLLIRGIDYKCEEVSESEVAESPCVRWIDGPDLLSKADDASVTPPFTPLSACKEEDAPGSPSAASAAQLSLLTAQLEKVAAFARSLMSEQVVLVLGNDCAASVEAMRYLCTSPQGNWTLRWHGATFLSTELRVNGGTAVAVCNVLDAAAGGGSPELAMCRHHFAAGALRCVDSARLVLVLECPAAADLDAAKLLALPLSLNLTAEQLAACTYWFASTASGTADGVEILNALRSLLAGFPGEERLRDILKDVVNKCGALGGCLMLNSVSDAEVGTVDSVLQATPLAVASITLPGAITPAEYAARLNTQLQGLFRSTAIASSNGQHDVVADNVAQLNSLREVMQPQGCGFAFDTELSDAILPVLGAITERVEACSSAGGLTTECAADICSFLELLTVTGQPSSAEAGPEQNADPVARAKSALLQYLAHLRADMQARVPRINASAPAGLSDFLAPMRFLHALMSVYGPADRSAAEAVRAVVTDFHKELDALTVRLQVSFPIDGEQRDRERDANEILAATLLVATIRGFAHYDASAAVARVVRFAELSPDQFTAIEIARFLVTCDPCDLANRTAGLVDPLKCLEVYVQTKVTGAEAAIDGLNLSLPTAEQHVDTVVEAHTVLCTLKSLFHAYLEQPDHGTITRRITAIHDGLDKSTRRMSDRAVTAARAHVQVAEISAIEGRFSECETALLLVQRLIVGLYGSMHTYILDMEVTDAADRVNIRAVRGKVSACVKSARDSYDAAFTKVADCFKPVQDPSPQAGDSVGSPLDEEQGATGAENHSTVAAPSPAGNLSTALATAPPKNIAANLSVASTAAEHGFITGMVKGAPGFYKAEAAAFCTYLTDQITALLVLCEDKKHSYDLRLDVLSQLQQASVSLPENVWADRSPGVTQQLEDLKAEYTSVAEQCTAQDQPIASHVDHLSRYTSAREYTYCSLYSTAIAGSVRSAVQKLSGALDAKKTCAVLTDLAAVWPDWARYFLLCAQLGMDAKFAAVAARAVSPSAPPDDTLTLVVELTKKLGKQIAADLADVQVLVAGVSDVFPRLEAYVELAGQLYGTFLTAPQLGSVAAREGMLRRLCVAADGVNWLNTALAASFNKAAELLTYHPDQIALALAAHVLDFHLLNSLLTAFALSGTAYAKLTEFATPSVRASVPAVEALCTKCRSYKTVVEDVDRALDAVAAKVRVALLYSSPVAGCSAEVRTAFYTGLASDYGHLLQMTVLQHHISRVTELARGGTTHWFEQIAAVRTHLIETVLAHEDAVSEESRKSYKYWHDNLSAFSAAFTEHTALARPAADAINAAQERLTSIVAIMVEAAKLEFDEPALAQRLVAIKAVAEEIPSAKDTTDDRINELLKEIKGRDKQCIARVAMLLESTRDSSDRSVQEHAQMLLKDYPAFEGYQLALFNTKARRFKFEEVLARTRAHQLQPHPHDATQRRTSTIEDAISFDEVMNQYASFNTLYCKLVREGLTQLEPAKEQCKVVVQKILRRADMRFVDRVRELMVQLFLYWTLSNSTHYFDNVGGQAAGRAADDSSWMYLKQPHAGQIISIFRMFGIDCGVGSEQELQNHFVQVGTGEGKSVVLAITSCIFALLGKDVHCVCYSEYLYKRDQADFKPLFEAFNVERSIKYGTFQDLCESYLNRRGDIRHSVQSIVECPTGQAWCRGGAEPSDFPADDVPKVLLIDEVDVFFKGDFYGCAYRPTAALRDETVSALLDYVWSCRDGFVPAPGSGDNWGSRHTTLAKFKGSPLCGDCADLTDTTQPLCTSCEDRYRGSPQYQACVARYPDWEYYIDEAIKQMLGDLKTFRTPKYKYDVIGDRIGYHIQDRIDFKTVDGYKTLFAYYQAAHEGKISAAALKEQKCIRIDCGAYSYAEIPKIYDHLMGVSGTLEALQDAERDILYSAYKVQRLTYTASVYSDATSKLTFSDSDTDVKIVSVGEHSAAIAEQIRARRGVPCDPTLFLPVLVFFKTSALVKAFKKYLADNGMLEGATIRTVTEENTTDKEDLIRQAVRAGTVTLLSRELGRGTDFYVYSDSIDAAGGVVVIQTFLSEDVSEEVQIKGRTARQGNNGSYCLVLSEQDLLTDFNVDAASLAPMRVSNTYVSTLSAKRAVRFEDHYEQLEGDIAVLSKEYDASMQFIDNLAAVPNGPHAGTPLSGDTVAAILNFLKDRNACPPAPIVLSRTLVLMDATDSMSSLLDGAKDGVHSMFTGAQAALREAGVQNRTFEMQFAVYRNYNSGKEKLFQCSKWTSDASVLKTFMESAAAAGGAGREAIEIGMWHANREIADRGEGERYQVLLIGDMPPNLADTVTDHRGQMCNLAAGYWSDTPYAQAVYFEDEFKKVVLEEVPVHAFYIGNQAPTKRAFIDIALRSNGVSTPLDMKSEEGADTLKRLITERVLDDVVGGGPEGRRLREIYSRLQQGLQATG